jgi:mannose-1-phosphate guanylyltransferase
MKAIIFAGGVGTRLWPLSRKSLPKQFVPLVDNKTTLQLTVERLYPDFSPEDVYIASWKQYIGRIQDMFPDIPQNQVVGEPVKRDNGPAVALMTALLMKKSPTEPVVILWSDHLVKYKDIFNRAILASGERLKENPDQIVFIGQKPRFASENIGWIESGDVEGHTQNVAFRKFVHFQYRPNESTAREYFQSHRHCWNLGYFVTTPQFLDARFRETAPELHRIAHQIADSQDVFAGMNELYPNMPEINFDKAVLESLPVESASVVIEDIGWSDIGAWEALKEALAVRKSDVVTQGRVLARDSKDDLIYNFEDDKVIVCLDVDDMVVVNTKDVILIGKKSSITKVKELVESFPGTEYENLT